jgi:hypothetical protein
MDKATFINLVKILDEKIRANKAQYCQIMNQAQAIDHDFCECGWVQEWLESEARLTPDELYEHLLKLRHVSDKEPTSQL